MDKALKFLLNFIALAVGCIAVYYGSQNMSLACSHGLIEPGLWLVVYGGVILFINFASCPLICFCGPIGAIFYATASLFYGVFSLAWALFGGFMMWKDNRTCRDTNQGFYMICMSVVVFALVHSLLSCCSAVYTCHTRTKNRDNDV